MLRSMGFYPMLRNMSFIILHAVLFCASAGLLRFARNDGAAAVIASEAKQSGKKDQCANSYRAKYNMCRLRTFHTAPLRRRPRTGQRRRPSPIS